MLVTMEMDLQSSQRVSIEDGEPNQQRVDIEQRVAATAPPVTTTTNPTNPRIMATKPWIHLRFTRANTPGTTPTIPVTAPKDRRSTQLNIETNR